MCELRQAHQSAIRVIRPLRISTAWAEATSARLERDCVRLDEMTRAKGWRLIGGASLFRLYETPDALAAQEKLARGQIWSRVFAQRPTWLRLGLPGIEAEWTRVAEVLAR